MKKRNVIIGYLVLLMLVATFAACSSTRTHESTGEYVANKAGEIARSVKGVKSVKNNLIVK
ncbi:MAG: BON domain-containing protein [Syntrophorhabdales bacterium]